MNGLCKLCRLERNLRKSHYIPKSVYKAIKRANSSSEHSLVRVNRLRQEIFSSDRQVKKPLLCNGCENKFSRNGETIVVGSCYKGEGQFKLRTQLDGLTPSYIDSRSRTKHYHGEEVSKSVRTSAYAYFALSMVWRGSVGNWGEPYSALNNTLSVKDSELLRQYLCCQTELPKNIMVHVYVDCDFPSQAAISAPPTVGKTYMNQEPVQIYTIMIPGILISVMIGDAIKKIMGSHPPYDRVIFQEWNFTRSQQYRDVVSITQSCQPTGKFATQIGAS